MNKYLKINQLFKFYDIMVEAPGKLIFMFINICINVSFKMNFNYL